MESVCNGIVISQRLENGVMGGPKQVDFSTFVNGRNYTISISQFIARKVKIISSAALTLDNFWDVFNHLDCLLMLLDGKFIPIQSGVAIIEHSETEISELNSLIENRASLYRSADYSQGNHSCLLDFDLVLTETLFLKWLVVQAELDILHQMVLYSMSDISLPIDCKCAFLIEAFNALAELVKKHNKNYKLPSCKEYESKLGKRLISIIDFFGNDIFAEELAVSRDKLVKILVDGRNRIAHIKSKQKETVLNGPESVLYAIKLSYLYRKVLLSLLGIDYSLYSMKLRNSIDSWNTWNGILGSFLIKLNQAK